jgi:hypothetical protein
MTFDSKGLQAQPGQKITEDAFREVELTIAFKRLTCHRCEFASVYKFRVQQIRRKAEIQLSEGETVRDDHRQIWQTIPRFAEIPETVKCKRCGEVIGLETRCIY